MEKLSYGRFLGISKRSVEVAGMRLTDTVYPIEACLPWHFHERPYFCLVTGGSYEEEGSNQQRLGCRRGAVVYHPAGAGHANRFGPTGGSCFNLEFDTGWTERMGLAVALPQGPTALEGTSVAPLLARIRSELRVMDNVSALAIESLALELIVASVRRQTSDASGRSPATPWIARAEDFIRSHFKEPLTLADIAAAVQRHPVHLARQFRRQYGCTVGDLIRRLRIEHASEFLRQTEESVVAIALDCGFSGQAQFSTVFRRMTGVAPTQFRALFRSR